MLRFTAPKVLFVLVFLIPLAVFSIYEVLIASDRYQSVASAIITQERPTSTSIDLSFLGVTNTATNRDAYILKEFMQSVDMLKYLDEKLNLKAHFSDPKVDFLSRLKANASIEEFHDYFLNYATVEFDTEQQILRYSVQTFDRNLSQAVLQAVMERSQQFIDRLNDKVSNEQQRFLDGEIRKSERRLEEEKDRLIEFQRRHNLLTTESASQAILGTISTLEGMLAQKQSDLNARLKVLDPNAPQLKTLQLDINALRNQIQAERERLAGAESGSLSELDAQYREIQVTLEFVTNIYKANLSALEQARIEAARRLKYLIVVAQPSLAETSEYPNRPYNIITGAIVLLMAYFVVSLMVAIIREQA
jgi:capsular polysaccharide transport system permease protein